MRHVLKLSIISAVALILFYLSRFWIFTWWGREGLFGIKDLSPRGGLLQKWLRGTDFAPYELLIWVIMSILVLTFVQKIFDLMTAQAVHDGEDDPQDGSS